MLRATVLICLFSWPLCAQTDFSKLDAILADYKESDAFNGTILIAHDGKVTYSRSLGYADFPNQIPLDKTTPMHLASISKGFTTLCIMILKERGLLHYEDEAKNYLEDFPYDQMTIRHLMTSTSGLKRLYNKATDGDDVVAIDDMVRFIVSKKPKLQFKPGDEFLSSILGYCLLAAVIEKVSGKRFDQFLADEIFNSLEMGNTFLLTNENRNRFKAISYDAKSKEKEWFLGSYSGGVGIYSSAEDLLKWDQALYSEVLVSKETLAVAFEPFVYNDGTASHVTMGGWMRWKGQENLIFKNGDWVAYYAILFRDIERKVIIIIMNNRQNKISKFDLMDEILPVLGYSI